MRFSVSISLAGAFRAGGSRAVPDRPLWVFRIGLLPVNQLVNLFVKQLVNFDNSCIRYFTDKLRDFGYVWKDPRAISQKAQRQHLADAGARASDIRADPALDRQWRKALTEGVDQKGYSKIRPGAGDVIAVYSTGYIADDSLDFVRFLIRLAQLGAGLHVVDQGTTLFPNAEMATMIENDIAERRQSTNRNCARGKKEHAQEASRWAQACRARLGRQDTQRVSRVLWPAAARYVRR